MLRTLCLVSGLTVLLWSLPALAQERESGPEKVAPGSASRFSWDIIGPDKPNQNPCGDTPPTPYMVTAKSGSTQGIRVLHVIWHKTAIGIPEAIDRVIVDTDVDEAANKTPHFAHFFAEPRNATLSGDLVYAICYFDFCSVGRYDLLVTVIWEDISEVEVDGVKRVNHRRYTETKTKHIDAQKHK